MKNVYAVTARTEDGREIIEGGCGIGGNGFKFIDASNFLSSVIEEYTYLELEQYCPECMRVMCNCVCED